MIWIAGLCLFGSHVALLVAVVKLALDRESDRKRLLTLELEAGLATTVYAVKGVPSISRMPWRIRLQWWKDRQAVRWRKLLNL